jgi:hypothetical protein
MDLMLLLLLLSGGSSMKQRQQGLKAGHALLALTGLWRLGWQIWL